MQQNRRVACWNHPRKKVSTEVLEERKVVFQKLFPLMLGALTQWKADMSSWDQPVILWRKKNEQKKMKPTPKLPLPPHRTSSTLRLSSSCVASFEERSWGGNGPLNTRWCRVKPQAGVAANAPGHGSALDPRDGVKHRGYRGSAAAGKSEDVRPRFVSPGRWWRQSKHRLLHIPHWPEQGLPLSATVKSSHSNKHHLSKKVEL